jgi:hypothetical protein
MPLASEPVVSITVVAIVVAVPTATDDGLALDWSRGQRILPRSADEKAHFGQRAASFIKLVGTVPESDKWGWKTFQRIYPTGTMR